MSLQTPRGQALRPKARLRCKAHHLLLGGPMGGAYQAPQIVHLEAEGQKPHITRTCSALMAREDRTGSRSHKPGGACLLPAGSHCLTDSGTVSPSPVRCSASAPHLFSLLVRGENVACSRAHGWAEGAAGALVTEVALAGPGLGGAQQLWVELTVGRCWCGRDDQGLQGCHLCLQHVDLARRRWLPTFAQG